MIAVNELNELKCNNKFILQDLLVLIAPYAPHFAEELWEKLGHTESITQATWPTLMLNTCKISFTYPVSFNGKMLHLELLLI